MQSFQDAPFYTNFGSGDGQIGACIDEAADVEQHTGQRQQVRATGLPQESVDNTATASDESRHD